MLETGRLICMKILLVVSLTDCYSLQIHGNLEESGRKTGDVHGHVELRWKLAAKH